MTNYTGTMGTDMYRELSCSPYRFYSIFYSHTSSRWIVADGNRLIYFNSNEQAQALQTYGNIIDLDRISGELNLDDDQNQAFLNEVLMAYGLADYIHRGYGEDLWWAGG